jgi:hypothetical protein
VALNKHTFGVVLPTEKIAILPDGDYYTNKSVFGPTHWLYIECCLQLIFVKKKQTKITQNTHTHTNRPTQKLKQTKAYFEVESL